MKIFSAILLFLFTLTASQQCPASGARYLSDLSGLIQRAERIDVIEHSSPMDFYDPKKQDDVAATEIVYKRLTLTPRQKDSFAALIKGLEHTTQDAFPACIFNGHHRIAFFANGRQVDVMEVCFECGQVKWSGSKATPPWAI